MARCPFAQWMPLPWSSGHYLEGPFKILHHTTEGNTAQGAFDTYQNTHDIPHFTIDRTTIYQHVDTDTAVTALAHPHGTVETNRSHAIQFELVAFAGQPKSQQALFNAGRLCRWAEQTHGIPQVWPNGPPNPPRNGQDPGHHNRNEGNWRHQGGHYGHSHVPANVHWDPAYTAAELAFLMGVRLTDVPDVVAEHPHFEPMEGIGPRGPAEAGALTVVARPGLRLRSGPGTDFDVIRLIPFGTQVHPVKTVGSWTQVDLLGDAAADGFVHSSFLA
jgi:hypothetical protein